ncbi:MAG: endosialidase [Lachnospiraceae bacterium]|nr:endosialidase [Lachnospiraceae bacterium]
MSVVKDLIQKETDGTISFGDYTLNEKSKKGDFSHNGDVYKIKTYNKITKLEKNDMFVYESVPGTSVSHLSITDDLVTFSVEGPSDAEVTLELVPETEYFVSVDGKDNGSLKTNLGGKLTLAIKLDGSPVKVEIKK